MCGFTGFYVAQSKRSRNDDHGIIRGMSDALTHRGPDFGDVWQDPDISVAFGHRRLSILDLSEHGQQPMASDSDRYMIVFNGEIYNHLSLRTQYLPNHAFRGHSDTETLLALFEVVGFEKTLELINGMFAFALWDRQARVLHFARDRFGKKPLYIGWAGSYLVFGSEMKALQAYPDFKGAIDRKSLELYTRYNCVPAPQTIYEGVWQVKPGHSLSLELRSLNAREDLSTKMDSYWSAEKVASDVPRYAGNTNETIQSFEDVLTECVKDRMLSDVPLGAFLSGGIDSSAVVALMQKISDKPIHTYTIGFEEAGFDEAVYARDVAAHLGTDHHEHYCSARDALDIIPKLADMYDEPFADQSAIPTYLVAQFARKDVTVALSGDGGDEMLGGYSRHISTPKITGLPGIAKYAIDHAPVALLKTLFPKKPLLAKHLGKASAVLSADTRAEVYDVLLSNWGDAPVLNASGARLPLNEDNALGISDQLMLWDTMNYLPNDILTKVDRASMAVSLEARAPLLDRRVFEFAWGLPHEMKIRNGQGKWLLREVLAKHVPRNLFERPKQGFNIPIGEWLRGDLRDWAEDLLDETAIKDQGLLDAGVVRNTWQAHLAEHVSGRGHHSEALWNILMFQAWHRRWQ